MICFIEVEFEVVMGMINDVFFVVDDVYDDVDFDGCYW